MKRRDCGLCDLKSLLLFCVVLGHALERDVAFDAPAAALYRAIYLFHMPLFAFVSGFGARDRGACLRQAAQAGKRYLCAQGLVVLVCLAASPGAAAGYLARPYWHLWYLLSLACWCLLRAGLDRAARGNGRRAALLALAAAAGLAAGCVPSVGRTLSLSRTLVFFPFFLAGSFWGGRVLDRLARRYWLLALALPVAAVGYAALARVPVSFLYQAEGYAAFGLRAGAGAALRAAAYCTAAACSAAALILCPRGRNPLTRFGGDTQMIYLLHPLFITALEFLPYPTRAAVPAAVLFTALIFAAIDLCFRWRARLVVFVDGRARVRSA